MILDLSKLHPGRAYSVLTNIVVPRPIAWITSQNATGIINLAPFSFFNMVGSSPPLVAIGVGDESPGQPKHTAKNIAATKEFVVNLVTEELTEAMNASAADFPEGMSELAAVGLHTAPSTRIKVPRVAEAKASLECVLHAMPRVGNNNLVIAEIVAVYIADEHITPSLHVENFTPIGRMGSPSYYCRTEDRFEVDRFSYAQWQAAQK